MREHQRRESGRWFVCLGPGERPPPYLAIALVARPQPGEQLCLMKAYLHPCVSAWDPMLVYSAFERRTLLELRRPQQFLATPRSIQTVIEKPMFDVAKLADLDDSTAAPREPYIPDFVFRTSSPPAGGKSIVLIETMGFADDNYRSRKVISHLAMARIVQAPVLIDDFHFPPGQTQLQRDLEFWASAHRAVTGAGLC